jgi:hypothetical protein
MAFDNIGEMLKNRREWRMHDLPEATYRSHPHCFEKLQNRLLIIRGGVSLAPTCQHRDKLL